ncbi:hypothetical protein FACS1894127_0770 [Clostridia bacterium]|nr:hypothetical protein FACS1894127_0770 [Clostridia bacterium]
MKDKFIIALFMAVLLVFMVWEIISPDRAVSEAENRKLAAVPEMSRAGLASGKLMSDFESYATDQFPIRDMWVKTKNIADIALGKTDNGRVYYGKGGNLFQIDDIDVNRLRKNIGYINDFYEQVKLQYPDVTMGVLPIPSSWNVEGSLLPAHAPVADEEGAMGLIRDGLSDGIDFCDPTKALKVAFENGEYVYYRTDHHWTSDGAYLGYREWAESMGLIPPDAEEFTVRTVSEDFLGTGDSKAGLPWTRPDVIKVYDRKGFDEVKMYVKGKLPDVPAGDKAVGEGGETGNNGSVSGVGTGNNGNMSGAEAGNNGSMSGVGTGNNGGVSGAEAGNNGSMSGAEANTENISDEGYVQSESLDNVPEGMFNESKLLTKDKYAYFLGGNDPVVRIDTDAGNGKTLLVVKDSFANCFVPFLTSHYEHIILLDLRYYKDGLETFFKKNGVESVLLLYGAVQLANDRNLFYLQMSKG